MSREVHAGFCERRGVRLPPPTHLVVMCQSREEAKGALEALRAILAELGLTLKEAKTRIVELREGGEGLRLSRLPSPLGARQHARFAASLLPGPLALASGDAARP